MLVAPRPAAPAVRASRRERARWRSGSGLSRPGAACIVRRRTSRQERPSLTQRGQAHDQRGGELDRLQDDPVGERIGRRHVVGAGEHRHAGGLEDADVGRRGGDEGGDVDREQHAAAAARRPPARRARAPSAAASSDSHCSAQAPSCASVATAAERGRRKTGRPCAGGGPLRSRDQQRLQAPRARQRRRRDERTARGSPPAARQRRERHQTSSGWRGRRAR